MAFGLRMVGQLADLMVPEIWLRFLRSAKTAIGSPMLGNMGPTGIHFFRRLRHNTEMKGRTVSGEGKTAEIDGGYFGGYVKPASFGEDRKDRRPWKNKSGKRQCVVIVGKRDGNSLPAVFRTEDQALSWIKTRIQLGTVVNANEAAS